jgi:3-hydroxy-3-methylglutaryl CoA synthase
VKESPITFGITGFGGYIPRSRLQRASIASAHRWMAPDLASMAKGDRAFCGWDEDSVTMGVEAARDAIPTPASRSFGVLVFATTRPSFADLSGAALIAAALDLAPTVRTLDVGQSQRSGVGALLGLLQSTQKDSLLIVSDHPSAKPASVQELTYGAGAAALAIGSDRVLGEFLGGASLQSSFVDHFRGSDERYDYYWEERWIRDEGLSKLIPQAVDAALKDAGVVRSAVKHFIFASPLRDAAALVAKRCGFETDTLANPLDGCGYAGCAHACLMLAHQLETAAPGAVLLLVGFGQGCDVIVLRVTDAIRDFKSVRGVSGALADATSHDAYLKLLSFEGSIELEWGMRSERGLKTSLTEQYRSSYQLAAISAGRCTSCHTIQFPQLAYCVNPNCAVPSSPLERVSLADKAAQVLTYTADWLSFHPSPPLYVGFVQFDVGARLLMEITDVGTSGLEVGTPLKIVHRIKDIDKARGYPRYFWKATPTKA